MSVLSPQLLGGVEWPPTHEDSEGLGGATTWPASCCWVQGLQRRVGERVPTQQEAGLARGWRNGISSSLS